VSNVNDVVGAAHLQLTAFALARRVYAHSMRRGIEKSHAFISLTSEKCQFMPTSIASSVLVLVAGNSCVIRAQ
jgi:hypothetical protein